MSTNENINILPKATIQMVVTQTNYSEEEAILRLSNNNNDPIKVIREFMGLDSEQNRTKNTNILKTKSQERYRIIREEIYKDNHNAQLQNKN